MKIIERSPKAIKRSLSALVFFAAAFSAATYAAPVHISVATPMGTQEFGAGISVGKGAKCFIVAPLHVVEIAQTITITDRRGNTALATHFQAPDGVDAILLKVEDNHSLVCPEDWHDGNAAEDAMYDAEFLISKKVKAGGMDQRRFFPGSVTSTTISVQPYSASKADRLMEGDSGSSLYAQNMLLGMIVSVDTSTGEGLAIKQSQLHALFSNFMLDPAIRIALINPVYQGYQENRYATTAVTNFIETRTPFAAMQMSPAVAKTNLTNERRGIAPQYPENVDFVIKSTVISNQSSRIANPNYDHAKSQTKNFGQQLVNRVSAKDFRYYHVANIDIEVTLVDLKTDRRTVHIERSQFKTPMTGDVDQRTLANDATVNATIDALVVAMNKFGITIADEKSAQLQPEKKENILSSLFRLVPEN
jgi:hypothetical protein